MESAAPLATSMPASTAVPRSRAPMTASGPPIATAMSSATMLSSSVAGSRFMHEAEHVLPQRDRGAEIAVRHAGQPDEELLEQRLVEAVERAQPVDVGLAGAGRQHHGDRIARRDADHHEDHDRHAEQRDRPSSAGGSGTFAAATFRQARYRMTPKNLRLFGHMRRRDE